MYTSTHKNISKTLHEQVGYGESHAVKDVFPQQQNVSRFCSQGIWQTHGFCLGSIPTALVEPPTNANAQWAQTPCDHAGLLHLSPNRHLRATHGVVSSCLWWCLVASRVKG